MKFKMPFIKKNKLDLNDLSMVTQTTVNELRESFKDMRKAVYSNTIRLVNLTDRISELEHQINNERGE